MSTQTFTREAQEGHQALENHCTQTEEEKNRKLQRDVLEAVARATTDLMELDPQSPPTPTSRSSSPAPCSNSSFHPKTGRIRLPRDHDTDSEDGSDDEFQLPQEVSFPKLGRTSWSSDVDAPGWVSTAKSPFGVNKPKCPPCWRLKKKDPCRGPPPCRECVGKGRRTVQECQEWGEGYVKKIRKGRVGRPPKKLRLE